MKPSRSFRELRTGLSIPLLVIPCNRWMTPLFLVVITLFSANRVYAQNSTTIVRSVVSSVATTGVNDGSLVLSATAGLPVIGLSENHDVNVYQGFWYPSDQISSVTGIAGVGDQRVLSNTPNPFTGTTSINYRLPARSNVQVRIYDLTGRLVLQLVDDVANQGDYSALWNGIDESGHGVASGYYICRLEAQPLDLSQPVIRYQLSMMLTR